MMLANAIPDLKYNYNKRMSVHKSRGNSAGMIHSIKEDHLIRLSEKELAQATPANSNISKKASIRQDSNRRLSKYNEDNSSDDDNLRKGKMQKDPDMGGLEKDLRVMMDTIFQKKRQVSQAPDSLNQCKTPDSKPRHHGETSSSSDNSHLSTFRKKRHPSHQDYQKKFSKFKTIDQQSYNMESNNLEDAQDSRVHSNYEMAETDKVYSILKHRSSNRTASPQRLSIKRASSQYTNSQVNGFSRGASSGTGGQLSVKSGATYFNFIDTDNG